MGKPEIAEALEAFGQFAVRATGGVADGIYIYSHAVWNAWSIALFKDEGDKLTWIDAPSEMFDTLGDLWYLADDDKKWVYMYYEVRDGEMSVDFDYDENGDRGNPEVDGLERRSRIMAERFGNKQIVYPEWDTSEFTELREGDIE